MTLDQPTVEDIANDLREAERTGRATTLVSRRCPTLDWAGARRIALARDRLRIADGDELIGYKLGWTSAAMREALGIERPNWGTLWRSQLLDDTLDPTPLRHAKVEPEFVYVADRDLEGPAITADAVHAAARGWAVGLEVVHPRWPSFDFTWLDNTADNSSAHAVAIGEPRTADSPPAQLQLRFSDGTDDREGSGGQAMGSPAEAVAWLVRELSAEARSLHRGQIVFTGGITAPFDVHDGNEFMVRSPQLGSVGFAVAART